MKKNDLLNLASCAAKSTEEAKKAEAHARACRVYAKKVRSNFTALCKGNDSKRVGSRHVTTKHVRN